MPELTEKACKNWQHIWPIIKPEVFTNSEYIKEMLTEKYN